MPFSKEQNIQEREYSVPYHFLYDWESLIAFPDKLHTAPIYLHYIREIINKIGRLHEGMSFLDAGCGDGRLVWELRESGCQAEITGFDYSEVAVKFARVFNPDCEFFVYDLTDSSKKNVIQHDVVVSVETLEHIEPDLLATAVRFLRDSVKPGGRLVITVPHVNRPLDAKHYQHFTTHSLRATLADYFEEIEMHGFNKKSRATVVLTLLTILYYYLYPLKKIGLRAVTDAVSNAGFRYFEKYLKDCDPDDGHALIAVCRRKY